MKYTTVISLFAPLILVVVVVWFGLTSPVPCNRLIDQQLVKAPFSNANVSSMTQWIKDSYPLGRLWLSQEDRGNIVIVSWRSWEKEYFAITDGSNHAIRQRWVFPQVTIRDVQRCLGKPEAYAWSSGFPADAFRAQFAMWYQKKGYIFSTGRFHSLTQPVIDDDTRIWNLILVKPATISEMAQAAYPAKVFGERIYSDTLTTITPWPTIFESIVLTRTDLE